MCDYVLDNSNANLDEICNQIINAESHSPEKIIKTIREPTSRET